MDKKILVTRSSMPPIEEYIEEIKTIWDSHWLTNMGDKHKELQRKLTAYLGVDNVDLLTNGHMALELSMQALNLQGSYYDPVYICVDYPCYCEKWAAAGIL